MGSNCRQDEFYHELFEGVGERWRYKKNVSGVHFLFSLLGFVHFSPIFFLEKVMGTREKIKFPASHIAWRDAQILNFYLDKINVSLQEELWPSVMEADVYI